ncbi:MAG: metal-dependent hydrolase [Magnetospirillum sp.]|nr:metal-dependent hydrolase [Magnetospirillum sp.]
MMVVSHVVLGASAWVAAGSLGLMPKSGAEGAVIAALGALLPDLDHPSSWLGRRLWVIAKPLSLLVGHRGITHSLLAMAAGVALLTALRPAPGLARLIEPLALGYLSHIAADALTPAGVPLLWPWRQRFGLGLCATGGAVEMLVVAACAAATFWLKMN